MGTFGCAAIVNAVLVFSSHNGIEGRTVLLYFGHLHVWVLQHIKEFAPIGSEQELVAYGMEDIDDAEEALVELEDDLQLLLADAICYTRTGSVETGSSLCIKKLSHCYL